MGSFCMNSYLRRNLVGIVLSKNTEFLQESLLFTGMMRCSQKQMEKKKTSLWQPTIKVPHTEIQNVPAVVNAIWGMT